jgi:hypothetical protein
MAVCYALLLAPLLNQDVLTSIAVYPGADSCLESIYYHETRTTKADA